MALETLQDTPRGSDRSDPLTRALVERLAEVPSECELDAIQRAIARLDYEGALARTIARAVRQSSIPAELMAAEFPWCDSVLGIALVALAEGARGARLVELSERGRFPEDHWGVERRLVALHAAWILDGAALRERITAEMHRLLVRWKPSSRAYFSTLTFELAHVLGEASLARDHDPRMISDDLRILRWALGATPAHVLRVTLEAIEPKTRAEQPKRDEEWRPRTVRSGPKAGRNEPCPCGSGKKYKRCHGAVEDGGGEPTRPLTTSTLTAEEILELPFQQVALIEPSALADYPLRALYRRFVEAEVWGRAESILERLISQHRMSPEDVGLYRSKMIEVAVGRYRNDVAYRHFIKLNDTERAGLDPFASLGIALQLRSPDLGERILAAAACAIEDDTGERARNLAHYLLFGAPALGLLVVRGCLQTEEWLAKVLLAKAAEARAQLELPPGDLAARIHADLQLEPEVREARNEVERLRNALQEVTRQLREMEQRVRDLETQLREREDAAPVVERGPSDALDPAEVRALRDKVETLQARIREGNEERAALRRQLAAATGSGPEGNDGAASNGSSEPVTDDGDEGIPVAALPRRILLPTWTRSAEEGLRSVPAHVAGEALRTVAALAAGDEAAWRAVKRPKRLDRPLLMVRIGIHHRLLFGMEGDRLEVVELVTRSALDVTLKRLRAT
jgi:SEC-C motif